MITGLSSFIPMPVEREFVMFAIYSRFEEGRIHCNFFPFLLTMYNLTAEIEIESKRFTAFACFNHSFETCGAPEALKCKILKYYFNTQAPFFQFYLQLMTMLSHFVRFILFQMLFLFFDYTTFRYFT